GAVAGAVALFVARAGTWSRSAAAAAIATRALPSVARAGDRARVGRSAGARRAAGAHRAAGARRSARPLGAARSARPGVARATGVTALATRPAARTCT